jgi:hypothetical protein
MILLFFDIVKYYGDVIGSSSSLLPDVIRTLVTILAVILSIYLKEFVEKRRENRKKLLVLYLFNDSVKSINKGAKEAPRLFQKYSKELSDNPFNELDLLPILTNPDEKRIELIDTRVVYEGFVLLYRDELSAVKAYRKLNNMVSYFVDVKAMLYELDKEFVKNRNLKLNVYYKDIQRLVEQTFTILKQNSDSVSYKGNENFDALIKMYKTVSFDETVDFISNEGKYINFVVKLRDLLIPFQNDVFSQPLFLLIYELESQRKKIVDEALEHASTINTNLKGLELPLKFMNDTSDELTSLLPKSKSKLKK